MSDQPKSDERSDEPRGWVLYDGECGVCRTWVPRWERLLRSRGFDIARLQEEWVAERLAGRVDDALSDIRLLMADGRLLSGADAYRFVLRDVPWLRPLYWLTRVPVLSWIFDTTYRRFAKNRHRISKACGLDDGPPRGTDA